jgi:hypothetical protein
VRLASAAGAHRGDGEGNDNSIVVLTEEREMAEGWLISSARARGLDGVGEARE